MLRIAAHRKGLVGLSMSLLLGLLVVLPGLVRAEEFTQPAFQTQWNATDAAVAKGQASRTYFWGPSPFAHTNEVYAEGPGGVRQVQYFDKARMELTKRTGTDPNFVTNGLLTVELVTGQLQVGDNQFISRQPATNPVAGDQTNNPLTPTYASFNQGKLAFGVAGSQNAPDRSGQAINEAVNKDGQVSTLSQPAANLKYSRYFDQTGHNLADVFDNFFQAAPLGPDKWLAVMGYPISEPFWAKDKVVVGGQSRDVLIQLFQRRALTYTPANPAAFQVEMGNIGQHYYVWRYGFDTRDQLPGNYRVILPDNKSLYSIDLRQPANRLKLGDTPNGQEITGLFALNEGRAVVSTDSAIYLADLTKARAFKQLDIPGLKKGRTTYAAASPDGRQIALLVDNAYPDNNYTILLYRLDTLPGDNLNVTATTTLFNKARTDSSNAPLKFSTDGRYLAFYTYTGPVEVAENQLHVVDVTTKTDQISNLGSNSRAYDYNWIGQSDQLIYMVATSNKGAADTNVLKQLDANSGTQTEVLGNIGISGVLPSPDGNYIAVTEGNQTNEGDNYCGYSYTSRVTIRSLANPATSLTPSYEQTSPGCQSGANLTGWSADGTYLTVESFATSHPGGAHGDVSILSLLTGQPIQKIGLQSNYNSFHSFNLAGPFYTLEKWYDYHGPVTNSPSSVSVKNVDGSQVAQIFNRPSSSPTDYSLSFELAQIVQVPRP